MKLRAILTAALFATTAACSSGAHVTAPDGFAELDSSEDYSFRATSAEGVVIAANWWGKVKTGVQVLTIFLLILLVPSPTWIDWLVYLMVAVTVVSGVDYFFGMRRLMREAELRRAQPREGSPQ